MKYLVYILLITMLTCCNARYTGDGNEVDLTQINGYLSKRKPRQTEAHILNKKNFRNYLKPIVQDGSEESGIDFETEKVAIIILPETSYDTRIILNRAFVEDSVLYVKYSVHQVLEKRPYRIVPTRVFTFDAGVPAKSIEFEYGETLIKKPIQ